MGPRTFARAYRRDPAPARSYGPRVDEMLVTARGFAVAFGKLLHDALSGRPLPDVEEYRYWVLKYTSWINQGMGGLEENLGDLLDALEEREDFTRVFMELNFHRLNAPMTAWWETLLYHPGRTGIDDRGVTRARYEIAKTAMAVVQTRDEWVARDMFFDEEIAELRDWATGALTEMDGMVALLEMCLRTTGTFVLPAPPQFEHMAGPANIDLVVIDPLDGYRVRGVQLKSSGTHRHVERYDPERVTLIDGSIDMYNERAVRFDPRRSDKRVVAWPGLISAHYLAELHPGRRTEDWIQEPVLRSAIAMAGEATQSVVSRNVEVYDLLIERIEADLGSGDESVDGDDSSALTTH